VRDSVLIGNTNTFGMPLYYPAKYVDYGWSALTVADAIEARLIEAEASLHQNDVAAWSDMLNVLRASALPVVVPPLPADSTTNASSTLQVDVMFHERAFWLFATGHRQGDLRRLIRQYGRTQSQVYPTGSYLAPGRAAYGTDVTLTVQLSVEGPNHLYRGCFDRHA